MPRIGRPPVMTAEDRKREIQIAAERLFGERGYEKVTMADIAAEVGMSKRTLYVYFSDKKALLNALVAASLVWSEKPLLEQVAQDAVERVAHHYKKVAEHVLSPRHLSLCRLAIAESAEIAAIPDILHRTGIAVSRQTLIDAIEDVAVTRRVLDASSTILADMVFGATLAKPLFDALLAGVPPDLLAVRRTIDEVLTLLFRPA